MDESRDFNPQGLRGLLTLTRFNYIEWRDIIDDYLDSQNWTKYIKEGIPADANDELKAKSSKISVVLKAAAGSQRTHLLGLRTPKEILVKLEEVNGGSSKGSLSSLQRQFSSPDPNKSVDDVAASLSQLQAQIGGISSEDKPTELSKKDILLRCYQEKYRTTVETLRIVAGNYTFAQIVERLRQAEFEANETSVEVALRAENNAQNRSGKKDTRKCYYCGKVGHIKPNCRKKKHDEKNKQNGTQKEKSENAGIAWIANKNTNIGIDDWCVDSGATSHMTSDRGIFIEYEDYRSTVGTAKSGISLNVVGRGKISCPINGQKTIFEGVLHIPELSANLLSPGKLTNKGLSVNLGPNEVIINRDRNIVAKGPKIGDTWVLRAHQTKEQALITSSAKQEEILLWHRRLGHPGAEKLSLTSETICDMPYIRQSEVPDCNTCYLTKSVRKQSREAPRNSASKKLERVFIDTWGPYKYPSLGGK
ncbi:hypothetical protein EPUL_005025, partial [Erysiphe pulchra]